jgi:hypothetical protein
VSPAELALRTLDLGRPEPGDEVLDRLEAEGHARNGFCEKCWRESGHEPIEYLRRLDEQEAAPSSPTAATTSARPTSRSSPASARTRRRSSCTSRRSASSTPRRATRRRPRSHGARPSPRGRRPRLARRDRGLSIERIRRDVVHPRLPFVVVHPDARVKPWRQTRACSRRRPRAEVGRGPAARRGAGPGADGGHRRRRRRRRRPRLRRPAGRSSRSRATTS